MLASKVAVLEFLQASALSQASPLECGVLLLKVKLLLPSAAELTTCEASSLADLTATAVPPLVVVLVVVTSDLPWESDTDTTVPPVDVASALASANLRTWVPAKQHSAVQQAGSLSWCQTAVGPIAALLCPASKLLHRRKSLLLKPCMH
jgi:hypothetical protein